MYGIIKNVLMKTSFLLEEVKQIFNEMFIQAHALMIILKLHPNAICASFSMIVSNYNFICTDVDFKKILKNF